MASSVARWGLALFRGRGFLAGTKETCHYNSADPEPRQTIDDSFAFGDPDVQKRNFAIPLAPWLLSAPLSESMRGDETLCCSFGPGRYLLTCA